mmetsp:Transcript_28984/g.59303  ORF Transcript_28984/g.59303 Transcript_28984/m.59303 type:complete len:119 (-) Transcript_28984:249-605(-)
MAKDQATEGPRAKDDSGGDEFVNRGLLRWEEERARWLSTIGPAHTESSSLEVPKTSRSAINIDVDEVIDLIFSNRWRAPPTPAVGNTKRDDGSFPVPVPLPQMIDILIDLWEAEGLEM